MKCHGCDVALCGACASDDGLCAPCARAEHDEANGGSALAMGWALLLGLVPGLGQAYLGRPLRGLTALLVIVALLLAHRQPYALALAGSLWFCQLVDVLESAGTARRQRSTSRSVEFALLLCGLAALIEGLYPGAIADRLPLAIAILLVGFGARLILTYFRSGEAT